MIILSSIAAFASVSSVTALLNGGGTLSIYDGVMPAFPEDPLTTQTLLANVTLPPLFYQEPVLSADGLSVVSTGLPIAPVNPVAAGSATFGRVIASDGTPVFDGNVGIIGSDAMFRLSAIQLSPAVPIAIVLAQYAQPRR